MSTHTDPRIDAKFAAAPAFARPILSHLRALIHRGCPGVQETVKWGHPSFTLDGKILCMLSAFKAHCRFGFWNDEMSAYIARDHIKTNDGPGQFGHITSRADLPDDKTLLRYLAEAVRLNATLKAAPSKPPAAKPARKVDLPVPPEFAQRLKDNPKAAATFEKLAPGYRREYLEWIIDAKRGETREKRMAATIERLAEGKSLNWKYQSA